MLTAASDLDLRLTDLARQVAAHRATAGTRHIPPALREHITAVAREARASGRSAQSIADVVGVSSQSILRWTEATTMVPVRLQPPASKPELVSPAGWRVTGLDLPTLVRLLPTLP